MAMGKLKQWERQPDDTDLGWKGFQIYLRMEPRTIIGTRKYLGMSQPHTYKIAKEHRWRERAQAYDNWIVAQEDKIVIKRAEQIAEEHLELIREGRRIAISELRKLREASEAEESPTLLNPQTLLNYIKELVSIERLVIGEATERQENLYDVSKLTGEEAEFMLAILAKME